MAKQAETFITGTFDDLCFYRMDNNYYVRMKSSLTGKRVKKSAAFKNTMKSAGELAEASVIASGVYRTITKGKRKVEWYRKMTGIAKLLIKKGACKEFIRKKLVDYLCTVLGRAKRRVRRNRINSAQRKFMPSLLIYYYPLCSWQLSYKCRNTFP